MMYRRRTTASDPRLYLESALILACLLAVASGQARADDRIVFHGGVNGANFGGGMDRFAERYAIAMTEIAGGSWTPERGKLNGIEMGAGYRIGVSPYFGLQLEGRYVQHGATHRFEGRDIPDTPGLFVFETDTKLIYLELAALAYFTPTPTDVLRSFVLTGPVVGRKSSHEIEFRAEGLNETLQIEEGVAGMSLGLLGAAGLAMRLGEETHLVLQVRYYRGDTELLERFRGTTAKDLSVVVGVEFDVTP